ncbi:hypothetical protein CDCA_CDCA02G0705 [Cyanidium caldarium]|uniref:Uncharacterized protein n=1 Tax=Cyanidium caldarium TaxID=2771 RepID=A0AAV9IQU5_CYACA|nr:hypothetical protein CDCA_CDCA02G0705 [Cyanidium caldarium]
MPSERTPLMKRPPSAERGATSWALPSERRRRQRWERNRRARRKLLTSSVLCFAFMSAELVGGYVAGSLAIMTDACHLLSDLAGFIISLVALQKSQKPATRSFSYGYGRAEVLGAFTSILLIWSLTAVLVVEAVRRLVHPERVNGRLMLAVAVLGIVVNVVMGVVLGHAHDHQHHQDGHEHPDEEEEEEEREAHSPLHGDPEAPPRPPAANNHNDSVAATARHRHTGGENINVRAAYLHVLGDLIQSVGVALAALLIWWRPAYARADPICTLFFSAIVLFTTLRLIGETVNVLMEGTPRNIDIAEVCAALIALDGVMQVQDLHVWSLSVGRAALSAQLRCDASVSDPHKITMAAEQLCRSRFGIDHTTIQVNCVDPRCCPPLEGSECAAPVEGSGAGA